LKDDIRDANEYAITGVQISWLGALLRAFGQTSENLGQPARIRNSTSQSISAPPT
jgi:hypothetical protein